MHITETNKYKHYVNKLEDLQRARVPVPPPGSITRSVLTLDEISMIQQKKNQTARVIVLNFKAIE